MSDAQAKSSAPFVIQCDPGASYRAIKSEIDAAVARVLASGHYILGPEVTAFETEFAAWSGAAHVVSCANGTDALVLSLRSAGVGPGCSVATVSHTAVATVSAIEIVGATPILLDIDPKTFTMDVAELAAVLERPPAGAPPIKAVIPVHIYGQGAAISEIRDLARRYDVTLIEDCAQSTGAKVDGVPTGRWGDAGTFSFYPTKNLGAFGDGGAIVTDSAERADHLRHLRQYGWGGDRLSKIAGMNSRLDELQAAILRVKLKGIDAENARRREIAAAYDAALAGRSATPPPVLSGREHVYHQYVIRTADRAAVQSRFQTAGLGTAIHYPVPVHLQAAYRGRVPLGPAQCRGTESMVNEILSMPMHAFLSDGEVERVCAVLQSL